MHTLDTPTTPVAADLAAIKQKQRAMWSAGDYGIIGTTLQIVGESLCEAMDLRAGMRVLDVAAGNGNSSLAAARRYCDVTSTDYAPSLLADGRRRAEAERLPVRFQEADAEALPFADGAFDAVMSSFGVMFAPNHARAAHELLRVCRKDGVVGLANWTPLGFIGRMFGVIGRHVPPPAGLVPPSRWGVDEYLDALFPNASSRLVTPKTFTFRYRSPQHFVDVFRAWYGPVNKAFAGLPTERQTALEHDLLSLIREHDISGDGTMVVPSDYVEALIRK